MIKVIIPIAALLIIMLCKKLPKIGGNVLVALLTAGVLSLLMGGIFNPVQWFAAAIDGLDRLSWVICLSVFGSIYAETQVRLGTMDTVMGALKAKFRNYPRILIVCIVLALVLSGSLMGDAVAASTVIGVLTIGVLANIGLAPEMICCIIVAGASMGSIMPPISQAFALSASLTGAEPDAALGYGYITVPIIIAIVTTYMILMFVKGHPQIVERDLEGNIVECKETAGEILKKNWKSLIPLSVLVLVVFFRSINLPAIKFDLPTEILKHINLFTIDQPTADALLSTTGMATGEGFTNVTISLYDWISNVSILKGLSNGIVLSIIFAMCVAFCFPQVKNNARDVIACGLCKVRYTAFLQICAAFMLGAFYAGGQIEAVQVFAQGLDSNVLKLGGAAALMLIGMLTGSQSTAQNVVFSFFGPALIATGRDATLTAVAGAHLAAAGMGLPPVDITTFVVAGIVGGMLGKKVDPLKSMIYMVPMCVAMAAVGILFMYI